MSKLLSIVVLLLLSFALHAQQCIKGDCRNGQGTFIFTSGAKYIGNFLNGQIHGQGILYFSNGDKYIGDWYQQQREGRGRFVFENGDTYLGQFHQDLFHGEGDMRYANGTRYEGDWLQGEPHGQGAFLFKNGDLYAGAVRHGRLEGYGRMTYINGARYIGEWENGQRHGQGELMKANGKRISGVWVRHHPEKQLIQTDNNSEFIAKEGYVENKVDVWAVVVGVGSYEHMPPLRFTDDDAYQIHSFLKSPEGGALRNANLRVLIDENATYRNILESMRTVLLRADENDVVLFYFSGHGLEGSFLPVDFDGEQNQLWHSEVQQLLAQCRAKHKIVIADACHSGGYKEFTSRSPEEKTIERYYDAFEQTRGGTALLLSSKQKEYSLEDGGLRSGVFSYFVIRGLNGEADQNADKIITIHELYNYTRDHVRHYTVNMQTPLLMGNFDKNMPIAVIR